MRLRKATPKEIDFACKRFHYAKSVPAAHKYDYSIFNDNGEWCGVILYSYGSSPQIGMQYGLFAGEVLELIRVALNGKQTHTSQAVAMTLKRLHKDAPNVRLVVSFADQEQGHLGTIYQASNWMYTGSRGGRLRSSSTESGCITRRSFHKGGRTTRNGCVSMLTLMRGKYRAVTSKSIYTS